MKIKIYTNYTLIDSNGDRTAMDSNIEREIKSVDEFKNLIEANEESLGKIERKIEKELVVEVVSDVSSVISPIKL